MSSPSSHRRRRKVLVDREFQLRFIWRLGGILFLYLLVFLMVSVVAPVAFTLIGSPPDWALAEVAFRVQVLLNLVLAPLLCTFLCLFVHGVLETFRIAGPNHRFKVVLRGLTRGIVPRGVQIRRGDYLQDTAFEMDEALVALHDRIRTLQEMGDAALARLVQNREDAPAAVEELRSLLHEFHLVTAAPECLPVATPTPAEPMNVQEALAVTDPGFGSGRPAERERVSGRGAPASGTTA